MYILVSPFTKTFDEIGLIYFVPDFLSDNIKIGQAVEVPIKTKIEIAIILEILPNHNSIITEERIKGIDISKIKSIITIKNNNILLKEYQINLVKWIAKYYYSSIHNSLNLFFPKNVQDKIKKQKLGIEVSKGDRSHLRPVSFVILNNSQKKVLDSINKSKNQKILLYGITGSGKTEIYIKLIEKCINSGKQAILLIPEIILTNQISKKIQSAFGKNNVIILNSSISPASKTKSWLKINSGEIKVIVGTRSTLFYPFKNLGLIIIDEEHDNSYISDKTPRYNSIKVAEKLSEILNIKMILGSGTPSIENMYKAIKGKYELVTLLEKYK